jgi:hypothetical protein
MASQEALTKFHTVPKVINLCQELQGFLPRVPMKSISKRFVPSQEAVTAVPNLSKSAALPPSASARSVE